MTSDGLRLLRCPAGPGLVDTLMPALASALDGVGPPLALLSERPAAGEVEMLRPDLPVESDNVAVVVTTSGSTGEPKGVLLSAEAMCASAKATLDRLGGPGQWLLALPGQYVAGLQVVVRSLVAGTVPVALDMSTRFDVADFVTATRRLDEDVRRYTALVPTQVGRLLAEPAGRAALCAFDAVLVGGAATGGDLLDRARQAGVVVVTTYGMSETCGGCVYDGDPLSGVLVDVRTDDRVRLAGPVLSCGYRRRPDLTAASFESDGQRRWHVTPDLGRWAPDGRLVVLGRADDVVVSGGVNVPLAAVDDVLGAHPAVSAVACLGVPDPQWGEKVVAFVTVDGEPPTLDSVRTFVARARPRAWAPRELVVVPEIPRLASGKVDRRTLRGWLSRRGRGPRRVR